ncbi:hypothetical protein NHQ30_006258 [Ciborinia camelliae]|nr:hypothetical protein NHQ30_006258 [Ciborinia camelliae]
MLKRKRKEEMAFEDLERGFQTLNLSEPVTPEYLLFNPSGDKIRLRQQFDDIPRYLFRVSTPESGCTIDEFWVKSVAATNNDEDSTLDMDPCLGPPESGDNAQSTSPMETQLSYR